MPLPTSPVDLAGRRVLITGAAGGIGGAAAQLCAAQGAEVILVDAVETTAIEARVGALAGAAMHRCDTSDEGAVRALAKDVDPIWALVDCAAICPFDDWLADDFNAALDRVLAVNVRGPLNLVRAFFPGMVERGEGRIVLCGSLAGWTGGLLSGPHYAFTKGGIHAFVRWLARRGAPHNVLVNGIAPGPVDTGMIAGKGYEKGTFPLGRIARPEEIAAAALFLAGPGSSYVTGSIIDVNGGIHAH